MNPISIFWADKNELFSDERFRACVCELKTLFTDHCAYRNPTDQTIIGRLLLAWSCNRLDGLADLLNALDYTPTGKPYWAYGGSAFSISHSDHIIALAVSAKGCIGADIVRIDKMKDTAGIFLHPEEMEGMPAAVYTLRRQYLSQLWARKEALGKLTGQGLGISFASVNTLQTIFYGDAPVTFFENSFIDGYACSIASTIKDSRVRVQELRTADLSFTYQIHAHA